MLELKKKAKILALFTHNNLDTSLTTYSSFKTNKQTESISLTSCEIIKYTTKLFGFPYTIFTASVLIPIVNFCKQYITPRGKVFI